MRNLQFTIGVIVWLAATLSSGAPAVVLAEGRPLLAVMDVSDGDGVVSSAVTNNLTEYLRGLLAETGRYVVIDRGRQAAAVKQLVQREKKESYKACYDRSCQVPLGRSLAADRILITSMMRIGSRVIVKAEIIDLATEASQGGATVKVNARPASDLEDRLTEALDELVGKLVGSVESAAIPREVSAQPAAQPATGGSKIATLRQQADSRQQEWLRLAAVVEDDRIPLAARLAAIDEFAARIGAGSPYSAETSELREYVAAGPGYFKNKMEWAALSFNASTMGLGVNAGFFMLRWNKFYLQLLQGNWTGGENDYTGSVGLAMGYPLYLDSACRHELRFGADVDLWMYLSYYHWGESYYDEEAGYYVDADDSGEFVGTGITPRATYIFHVARHFSLQAGVEAMLTLIPWDSDDYMATFAGHLGFGF